MFTSQRETMVSMFSFIMMDYFSLYFLQLMYAMSSFEIFEQKPRRARLLLSLCSESTLLNTCCLTISYSHHFSILAESARENQWMENLEVDSWPKQFKRTSSLWVLIRASSGNCNSLGQKEYKTSLAPSSLYVYWRTDILYRTKSISPRISSLYAIRQKRTQKG